MYVMYTSECEPLDKEELEAARQREEMLDTNDGYDEGVDYDD